MGCRPSRYGRACTPLIFRFLPSILCLVWEKSIYLLKLRAQFVLQFGGRLPAACQLPEGYRLEIVSPEATCPDCGRGLRRIRTSTHQAVGLMLGRPRVRRVQKGCPGCDWTEPDDEILEPLEQRWGRSLPRSAVGLLTDSFLDGLAAAHQARLPALRAQLEQDGGYAMPMDCACEPGTDVLFAVAAAPRSWTLHDSGSARKRRQPASRRETASVSVIVTTRPGVLFHHGGVARARAKGSGVVFGRRSTTWKTACRR